MSRPTVVIIQQIIMIKPGRETEAMKEDGVRNIQRSDSQRDGRWLPLGCSSRQKAAPLRMNFKTKGGSPYDEFQD